MLVHCVLASTIFYSLLFESKLCFVNHDSLFLGMRSLINGLVPVF